MAGRAPVIQITNARKRRALSYDSQGRKDEAKHTIYAELPQGGRHGPLDAL